jgi:colicin import membrane protein
MAAQQHGPIRDATPTGADAGLGAPDASALGRDPFMPHAPPGRGPALGLALLAHGLLIAALAFGVNWRNTPATPIAAELWSSVPQAVAPRAADAAAVPPPPVRIPPTPAPAALPVAPPAPEAALPDPQIAIEKARRAAAARQQAADQAAADKAQADKLQADRATRLKTEQARLDRLKQDQADAARQEAIRNANLKRLLGQASATGSPTDTGSAARSSGPSASYAGRIMARIKPNILFSDAIDGNPLATVEVTLAPDGSIVARRLIKPSGVRAWDEAVLRAVDRTETLPRDTDGRVPGPFQIDFRPRD